MALTIRELITIWRFKVNTAPLTRVNKKLNKTVKAANRARVAIIGALGGAFATRFAIRIIGDIEQTTIAFETFLGSAEEGQKVLKELGEFAAKTPFTLPGIEKAAKGLLAVGFSAEELLPTLKAVGDISSGLNVPMSRLVLNLGQVRTQGKLTGRELRDFNIAGVPLIAELAKNLGVAEKEIAGMVERGTLGFPDVAKAFQTMTSEGGRFFDLMDRQARTFFGMLSNLQDALILIIRKAGTEGFLRQASDLVRRTIDFLDKNQRLVLRPLIGTLNFIADSFEVVFTVFQGGLFILDGLTSAFGSFNTVLKVTALIMAGLLLLQAPLLVGFAALFLVIEDITAGIQGRKSFTQDLLKFLDEVNTRIDKLLTKMGGAKSVVRGFLSSIGLGGGLGEDIVSLFPSLGVIGGPGAAQGAARSFSVQIQNLSVNVQAAPGDIERASAQGIADTLDTILRDTQSAVAPAVNK